MLSSLRHQLMGLSVLMAVACIVVALLLFGMTRHGEKVEVSQTRQALSQACERIQTRYLQAVHNTSADQRGALQAAVLQLVLDDFNGVEGGIWQAQNGVSAYAYPTYQGSGSKNDVPPAELANIHRVAVQSLQTRQPADYVRSTDREVLLLRACPLQDSQSAWVMSRVHTEGESFYRRLRWGLLALFAVVLFSVIAIACVLGRWDRKLALVESDLVAADPASPQPVSLTGSDELDRLSQAINRYARRSVDTQREANDMAAALARGERLADIGRMVATVAHEIRNPIATMRLTAENALASPTPDDMAMQRLLVQIARLDGVVESLLTMAQPIKLTLVEVPIESWLRTMASAMSEHGPAIEVICDATLARSSWLLDPVYMERALDNLLRNAREHSPRGEPVRLHIAAGAERLLLVVSNKGDPVPEALSERLFEPFASGRPHGNGLGLALVREIVMAHGGQVAYQHADGVTQFSVELPWR